MDNLEAFLPLFSTAVVFGVYYLYDFFCKKNHTLTSSYTMSNKEQNHPVENYLNVGQTTDVENIPNVKGSKQSIRNSTFFMDTNNQKIISNSYDTNIIDKGCFTLVSRKEGLFTIDNDGNFIAQILFNVGQDVSNVEPQQPKKGVVNSDTISKTDETISTTNYYFILAPTFIENESFKDGREVPKEEPPKTEPPKKRNYTTFDNSDIETKLLFHNRGQILLNKEDFRALVTIYADRLNEKLKIIKVLPRVIRELSTLAILLFSDNKEEQLFVNHTIANFFKNKTTATRQTVCKSILEYLNTYNKTLLLKKEQIHFFVLCLCGWLKIKEMKNFKQKEFQNTIDTYTNLIWEKKNISVLIKELELA